MKKGLKGMKKKEMEIGEGRYSLYRKVGYKFINTVKKPEKKR